MHGKCSFDDPVQLKTGIVDLRYRGDICSAISALCRKQTHAAQQFDAGIASAVGDGFKGFCAARDLCLAG
jgi:hypothetical protein